MRIQFSNSNRRSRTGLRDLAARCARVVHEPFARKSEGVGNAGCPLHPQPRVRMVKQSTRASSLQVHRRHPAFPHAMVLTAYFVLSPVLGLFCHRRLRIWRVRARSGRQASANLTPASGRQDHTTSPSAASICRQCAVDRSQAETRPAIPSRAQRCRVHRIPPRVRDDRDTPLCGTRR
jgi:hypothetical protein